MKTVFITGGSRGIGAEAVRIFAKNGYRVAFSYLNSEKEALLLKSETGAFAIKCDVSKSDEVKRAVETINELFGGIDILINNAGISASGLIGDFDDEQYRKIIDTNQSSCFYTCRNVLPYMINKKSGVILNISSMWGEVGASCEVVYSMSKAGVIGFTKALAKEVGPSGIRVNCITPGVIETDMNKNLSKEDLKALTNETPLGRLGTPKDIAETLLFLADDRASFITGQIIGVNGGFII